MKSLTSLTVLLATAAVCLCALVKGPNGGNFELLILHNNDMHARFEQTSQLSGACTAADRDAGKCYGGFPRVAHLVKEARQAAQSGNGPPVLYLNAGDTYTGTAWFTIYKWKIAAEFINALQPDAVSLGNNEIVKESDELTPFINNIHTKILASNVILKSTKDNKDIQKSIVFDINGVGVGIVGYLTPDADTLDAAGDIEYVDEIIAVKQEVDKLKALNVKVIIALGHSTLEKDIEIAKEVDGLDFVIGGRKNKFFWDGSTEFNVSYASPRIVSQPSGKTVPVISSIAYDKYLGKMLTEFDQDGELAKWESTIIQLSSVPQDEEALQIVKAHYDEITAKSEEVLGSTAVVLDGNSCRTEECNFGNLITDAIMYYYAVRYNGETWTDAPIAIIPSGFLAGSIAPSNRPAPVTRSDLLTALPSESSLIAVTMNGTILTRVLEHSVFTYNTETPTGQFLQLSGIRATYDMSREPGSRLVDAVVRCWSCYVPEYYSIDDWRTYKVLMPVFLANGALRYSMLVGLERQNLAYDEVTCTADYIGLRSPVYPEVAGRIVLNNVEGVQDVVPDAASGLTASMLTVAVMPILLNLRNY